MDDQPPFDPPFNPETDAVVCLHGKRGGIVLISREDSNRADIRNYKWHKQVHKHTPLEYACRCYRGEDRKVYKVFLSHLVAEPAPGEVVQYLNKNGLDCRRENLRCVTRSQHRFHSRVKKDSLVGVKGVRRHRSGTFNAVINRAGRQRSLGTYGSMEEAAYAFDHAARRLSGEFARVNGLGSVENAAEIEALVDARLATHFPALL